MRIQLLIVAIACLGWALTFLSFVSPIVTWALFDRVYFEWSAGLFICGGAIMLLCVPFMAFLTRFCTHKGIHTEDER